MREVCRVLLDGQNFCQKLQALAVIKITKRKFSVSFVERSPLVVANSVDAKVTRVFNFSSTNFNRMKIKKKLQVLARAD